MCPSSYLIARAFVCGATCVRVLNFNHSGVCFIHSLFDFFFSLTPSWASHMILCIVRPFSREGDSSCMNKFIVNPYVCLYSIWCPASLHSGSHALPSLPPPWRQIMPHSATPLAPRVSEGVVREICAVKFAEVSPNPRLKVTPHY